MRNGEKMRCQNTHKCHNRRAPPTRTKTMAEDTQQQQAAAALRMTKAKVKSPAKARTKTREKGTSPAMITTKASLKPPKWWNTGQWTGTIDINTEDLKRQGEKQNLMFFSAADCKPWRRDSIATHLEVVVCTGPSKPRALGPSNWMHTVSCNCWKNYVFVIRVITYAKTDCMSFQLGGLIVTLLSLAVFTLWFLRDHESMASYNLLSTQVWILFTQLQSIQ